MPRLSLLQVQQKSVSPEKSQSLTRGCHTRHSLYDLAGIPFSIGTDVDPMFDFNQTSLYPCELFCLGEAVSDHKHSEALRAVTCPLSHQPLITPAPSQAPAVLRG